MIEWIARNGEVRERARLSTQRSYTVGRAADNDFVLDDPYVAAHHAQIEWQGEHWKIRDIGSVNGLLVHGQVVREAVLRHGEEVGLGQSTLRLRDAQALLAAERKLPNQARTARQPWLGALLVLCLGLLGLASWVTAVPPLPANFWLGVLRDPILLGLLWVVSWSVLSRIFVGNPWFGLHASIALRAGLVLLAFPWLLQNLAYAVSLPQLLPLAEIVVYLSIAWAVVRHLTIVFGRLRYWQVGGLVLLALLPIFSSIVVQIERRSQWFNAQVIKRLPDPAWRMVSPKPAQSLFDGLEGLKPTIDAMRNQGDSGEED
jgi:Inner membrane component of T3SS, cytoplasmic domain